MLALCETVECRRVQLLAYFGQSAQPCGNCDTCLTPPESWDGTVAAQKLLSTVFRLDRERHQRFGAGQIIDILLGKRTRRSSSSVRRTQRLRCRHRAVRGRVAGVVRQLLAQGVLAVEGDYRTFQLTEASRPVLRGERPVLLRRDPVKAARTRSSRTPAAPLPDDIAPIFEQLRAWRGAAAKEQGVPAYVIFHDATLREIATSRPTTLAALGRINGIGEAKLARHGQAVLDTLAEISS